MMILLMNYPSIKLALLVVLQSLLIKSFIEKLIKKSLKFDYVEFIMTLKVNFLVRIYLFMFLNINIFLYSASNY